MSVNFGVYGLQSLLRVSECSPFFSISTAASKDFLMKLSFVRKPAHAISSHWAMWQRLALALRLELSW
jgi:hypothetical protein